MKVGLLGLIIAVGLVGMAPSQAEADWLLTPFIGQTFGKDAPDQDMSYGASITWMGAGVAGFEVDFSSTPDFFGASEDFGDNNVTSVMASVIAGVPVGGQSGLGIRPYAAAGLGLIRSRADGVEGFFEDVSQNDFGFNIGGGVAGFFNDNVGARVDLRYFRALSGGNDADDDLTDFFEAGNFDFWRWTAGVTFRF